MRFSAYPEYKKSGIEWLGDVPKSWELGRGDSKIRSVSKTVEASDLNDQEIFHYSIPVVQETGDGQLEAGDEIQSSKLLVECKQVLISKLNPRKNTVCIAWPRGPMTVCSGEFVPLQSDTVDLNWLSYLVGSENFRKRLESLVESATRSHQRVNPIDIIKFQGAFPSDAEQTQIARFLDYETAKIDALIEQQQCLIELLREKRQAVISHAVTKGLDPTVPMKDSGVEWLGEVPAHWSVMNFSLLVQIAEGQVDPRVSPYLNMLLIAPNHIESGTGRLISCETAESQGADSGKYLCEEGDVIYSKIRPALRKACIAPQDCLCSADMYPMRGRLGLTNEYLLWFVLSEQFSAFALLESDRVAMPKINRESLGGIKLPNPAPHEQSSIAKFILSETERIDILVDEALKGVKLLKERRSALISAAVTGKIDVRNWKPPVSESVQESQRGSQ